MTVPVDLPAILLPEEFIRTGRHGFPVLNPDGTLYGVVSLEDYRRAAGDHKHPPDDMLVRDIATRDVVTVFPDETVGAALSYMAPRDLSRLPVVSREDPRWLVGVVRRNDIVRAYELGALRREEARRRAAVLPTDGKAGAVFVDVTVGEGANARGNKVADLPLPREAVLVAICRDREMIIPHGDTLLQAGDTITALCRSDCVERFKRLIAGAADQTMATGRANDTPSVSEK